MSLNNLPRVFFVGIIMMIMNQEVKSFCDTDMPNRYPSVEQEYKQSEFVIEGSVISEQKISSPDDPTGYEAILYRIKTLQIFKGRPEHKFTIHSENTSSRFPMTVGEKYIIFALKYKNYPLFIDNCGNSGLANNSANIIVKIKNLSRRQ